MNGVSRMKSTLALTLLIAMFSNSYSASLAQSRHVKDGNKTHALEKICTVNIDRLYSNYLPPIPSLSKTPWIIVDSQLVDERTLPYDSSEYRAFMLFGRLSTTPSQRYLMNVHAAVQKVAKSGGYEIAVDKHSVFYGIKSFKHVPDITSEVKKDLAQSGHLRGHR